MYTTTSAAGGDTWGISGPSILGSYLLLAALLLAAAVIARRAARKAPGSRSVAGWDADPYRVAYLHEGPDLALTAALGALRAEGVLSAGGRSVAAARQRALVAALVAGGPVPSGLDPVRFAAAERALRAKRAATVAVDWPLLAAGLGDSFGDRFTAWARARPPHGALRDGWDFARALHAAGELPELGHTELAAREARWRYDGVSAPRPPFRVPVG
ncbi:hypothetical protein [Pseudonocardia sp.]|uniref:hypothetical protein n=1 Tax=Pseudonocardia sp. TaxID=60912 RepID=UPI00260B5FC9|nr:hypothetical protein [Pseudonocardia sp.]